MSIPKKIQVRQTIQLNRYEPLEISMEVEIEPEDSVEDVFQITRKIVRAELAKALREKQTEEESIPFK